MDAMPRSFSSRKFRPTVPLGFRWAAPNDRKEREEQFEIPVLPH